MDAVKLERRALEAIFAHARVTHPEECCGAIISRRGWDQVRRFTNIQNRLHTENPAENPRDGTTAYAPDSREVYAAVRAASEPDAHLSAFYHSHTVAGSYFSAEDRMRAMFGDDPAFPDVAYLVVSDVRVVGEARAFRWDESVHDFGEVPLVVRAGAVKKRKKGPGKRGGKMAGARPTRGTTRRSGVDPRPRTTRRRRRIRQKIPLNSICRTPFVWLPCAAICIPLSLRA